LKQIGRAFDKKHIVGVREEPRIREQDFGNFQNNNKMKAVKEVRQRFGRFFYRFPEGESAADVFDRVTSMYSLYSLIYFESFSFDDEEGSMWVLVLMFCTPVTAILEHVFE